MKTRIFTILVAVAATTMMGYGQRISSFTLDGITALGLSSSTNPTNNNSSKPGDLQIVFSNSTDLSNANAVIVCGTATVATSPMPTNWTTTQNIQLQLVDGETTTNAWYNITCKKIIPTTLPFTLATTVESNFAEQWTSTTEGWAGANLQKTQANCRFGNASANLIVAFTDTADSVYFNLNIAVATAPAGTIFDVDESADGVTWTSLRQYTEANIPNSGATPAEKAQALELLSTTRYIRWTYTKRASGNISLTGNLNVTKKTESPATGCCNVLSQTTGIYPVPATNVLNIRSEAEIATATVCNLAGQTVATYAQPNGRMDISRLPQGIYMVNLFTATGEKVTKRFVKQ